MFTKRRRLSMSERDDEPGGPQYGGESGGRSKGAEGGQARRSEQSSDNEDTNEQERHSGSVAGRGPTETERQG
jgi:hypothetical protein